MVNETIVKGLLQWLKSRAIVDIVFCPGGRNAPLVYGFQENQSLFKLYSFPEERVASFFALGMAKEQKKTVVVLTTSGTAVAQLLASSIEAYYSGVKLLFISADRPRSYRGTGAPQTIDQTTLLKSYCEVVDIDTSSQLLDLDSLSWQRSVHLNISFDEPLRPSGSLQIPNNSGRWDMGTTRKNCDADKVQTWCRQNFPFLVIAGALEPSLAEQLIDIFAQWKLPILAEASSHLKGVDQLKPYLLDQASAKKLLADNLLKGVLRIGHIPSYRLWRDMTFQVDLPILNISELPFPGMPDRKLEPLDIQVIKNLNLPQYHQNFSSIAKSIEFDLYPRSEPSLVASLSSLVPDQAMVYLGNSLSIRQWNHFAEIHSEQLFRENRGANGIDGQVSCFLGALCKSSRHEGWLIVGDLTAFYDLQALWALRYLPDDKKVRIVIVNNGGGKIFERIYGDPIFENPHGLNFSSWASMFSMDYQRIDSVIEGVNSHKRVILELCPCSTQTSAFYRDLE